MHKFVVLSFLFLGVAFYELSGGDAFDPAAARDAAMAQRLAADAVRAEGRTQVALAPAQPEQVVRARAPGEDIEVSRAELDLLSLEGVAAPAHGEPVPVELASLATTSDAEPAPEATAQPAAQIRVLGIAALSPGTTGLTPAGLLRSDTAEAAPQRITTAGLSPVLRPATVVSTKTNTTAPVTAAPAPAEDETAARSIVFAGRTTAASSANLGDAADIRIVTGSVVNVRSGPGTSFGVIDQVTRNTRMAVLEDGGNGWLQVRDTAGDVSGWIAGSLLTRP